MHFRDTSTETQCSRTSGVEKGFSTEHGDFVQYTLHCAGMSQYKAQEAFMAAHAVCHDGVRHRHCLLLSHHWR